MLGTKDREQIRDENQALRLSVLTVLGDRQDQQDSFGYELDSRGGVVTVCDGMGGLESGKLASSTAVQAVLETCPADAVTEEALVQWAHRVNDRVLALRDRQGNRLRAGTTLVSVLLRDRKLWWVSVGDSRAYLYRGGEMVRLTQDHNYHTVLMEQRKAGIIDEMQFRMRSENADALISYIGMAQLGLIDCSRQPLQLQPGDRVLAVSDGLYRLVPDGEICRVLENFTNVGEALQVLELKAQKAATHGGRDNMTAALLEIK